MKYLNHILSTVILWIFCETPAFNQVPPPNDEPSLDLRILIKAMCLGWLIVCSGAITLQAQDTCAVNDICETATVINNVISDLPFVCIESCNTGSTPETLAKDCLIDERPTTWFKLQTDGTASLMNIHVTTADFDAPTIALFLQIEECQDIQPISLTASNLPCITGSGGEAEAIGTRVGASQVYYILIGSWTGQTGDFELCINTISEASACVVDRNITVVARSADGPLTGPFYPNETVSVCLNVNSYTAANNGCQWFQGIVPVFGNGWDPSSFDGSGQPMNPTINGSAIGQFANGLYGTTTWDWFADVDYHHDDPFLQVGDFDYNGTYDICNILYEECPDQGGITGGCCGPCWGNPLGTILPSGWFAYGINGSCGTVGPPVRVDWGDGNTCGGGMGPWSFCFDLTVRGFPECQEDETTQDLSIGFFTFADGQVGAWTGSSSVCAFDQPAKLTLPMVCDQLVDLGTEVLPAMCSGDIFNYTIDYINVNEWDWNINPSGYVQTPVFEGPNGYQLQEEVFNTSDEPAIITYTFFGDIANSEDVAIKRVQFTVYPQIQFDLPDLVLCERDSFLNLFPTITGGTGNYNFQWIPTGEASFGITLLKPFLPEVILQVNDDVGCHHTDTMHIRTRPCHLGGNPPPIDDDNEPDHPKDPPPPDGNFSQPHISTRANPGELIDFTVRPVPARDNVIITLSRPFENSDKVSLTDVNGMRLVLMERMNTTGNQLSMDVRDLPDGLYILTLHSHDGLVSKRLVKM